MQNDVLDHCVQIHGGYGYMNEYRVARAWRDARVTKIWAGLQRDHEDADRPRPRPLIGLAVGSRLG